ncbi:DUF3558 family protein [Prauserella salsuginis]|nr:DUF3558 family protein [Prauserella salsuginis]
MENGLEVAGMCPTVRIRRGRQGGSSSTVESSESADAASVSELDPCSVLAVEEISEHAKVQQPEHTTVGGAPTCTWPAQAQDTAALVPTPSVAIRDKGGVKDMNDIGRGVQFTTEDGRDYAQAAGHGNCNIAIGVTEKTRVDIMVTGAEDSEQACELANTLTELAGPRVPQG